MRRIEPSIPIIRDVVFLVGGMTVFVAEGLGQARLTPMVLGMIMAAGPSVVAAYWGRIPDSPTLVSSPSLSSSSSPPSSSLPVSADPPGAPPAPTPGGPSA